MHSSIPFPGKYERLLASLSEPLHATSLRQPGRVARPGKEATLDRGYRLEISGFDGEPHLPALVEDLTEFLHGAMELCPTPQGFPIRLVQGCVGEAPPEAAEAHRLKITPEGGELTAETLDGLRRAVFRLEDEMQLRRAPILPLGEATHWTRLRTRISRNPLAPYRWLSGWELESDWECYPDAYLNRIAHAGVNALWVPGLFRNLIASPILPELGPENHRLERLRSLVARAARYGIQIYLFCIEPRALPEGHPVLRLYPELIGAGRSLCVMHPKVREYLWDASRALSREVPGLGGVINIFCGERFSNCWTSGTPVPECPRCREHPAAQVHATVLNTMLSGLKAGNPDARLLAWAYMMASSTESLPIAPMLEVIEAADPGVIWVGNFEHGGTKMACGREVQVHEYSLSCQGPAENFRLLAQAAREMGREVYAKLQMGNSYELSSLPWVTAPGIAAEKITTSQALGATGAMLGWIVGGVPGPMLQIAGVAAFHPEGSNVELMTRTAAVTWGEVAASLVVEAWGHFAEAWKAYPFHNAILYWGPITRAPAYPLYLQQEDRLAKPYNWGLDRQRRRQPYENDPHRWLGGYGVEEVTTAFRGMATQWERGLEKLRQAVEQTIPTRETRQEWHIATATRCQLLSTANLYEFNALRLRLKAGEDAVLERMRAIAIEERASTTAMQALMREEPWIGYQSEIFDYSYSLPMLKEKERHLLQTIHLLEEWARSGVDRSVLEKTVAELEDARPDDFPDEWGD